MLSLKEVVLTFALAQPLIKNADNNVKPIAFLIFINLLSDCETGIVSYFTNVHLILHHSIFSINNDFTTLVIIHRIKTF